MNQANQYLLDLPYVDWHLISDIPEEIATEVIELIDCNYHCQYRFNDDWTAFSKHTRDSYGIKPKGNTKPKDSRGRTIQK
jgi:hypothetical protein